MCVCVCVCVCRLGWVGLVELALHPVPFAGLVDEKCVSRGHAVAGVGGAENSFQQTPFRLFFSPKNMKIEKYIQNVFMCREKSYQAKQHSHSFVDKMLFKTLFKTQELCPTHDGERAVQAVHPGAGVAGGGQGTGGKTPLFVV